jgi:predicted MFS family arabinose efflux permease
MPSSIAEDDLQPITLYFTDSDNLSTIEPMGTTGQTTSVGLSVRMSVTSIGTWSTEPLEKPIKISGSVTTKIWVSGFGSANLEFQLLNNNEPVGAQFSTSTQPLSQTPQEFNAVLTGLDFDVDSGDVIGIEVTLNFRGAQCSVYWGGRNYPSSVEITCDSISLAEPHYNIDTSSQKVTINTTIFSAFGPEDIQSYIIHITGPTNVEHISQNEVDVVDGGINAVWFWEYGKDDIETGKEYQITITVNDRSGNSWSINAEKPIILEPSEDLIISSEMIQFIIIIIIFLIIGIFIAYKLFLGKLIQEKSSILKEHTEYFSDYKLLIVSEVLHSLAWYLLLVISLFIFRAAWLGWGDLLVGINEGLYQTVSVLLFLILAKGSDVQGRRKNMLLALILIGSLLLFIMAWLSFVPNPAITIIIILLFTLFVLCYYGTDNLELTLVTEYFPEKYRGKAFGYMKAIGNIGGLIGGVLSGLLFDIIGFWFCFMFAGFVMLSSFVVLFRIRDIGVVEEKISVKEWLIEFMKSSKQFTGKIRNGLKGIFSGFSIRTIDDYLFGFNNRKQMTLLFYTTLFTLIAYGMIVPFIFVFLNEVRGESATILSIVYTVFGIAIFLPINQILAGWLCDKYGAKTVYSGAIFAYIGLWGALNLTIPMTSSNVIVMAVFIFPVWPFLWIGYKMFVANITARNERVRGVTVIRLALGLGIVIGSIGGGVLLTYLAYETVFQLAMIFTFIAAIMAIVLLKSSKEVESISNEDSPIKFVEVE